MRTMSDFCFLFNSMSILSAAAAVEWSRCGCRLVVPSTFCYWMSSAGVGGRQTEVLFPRRRYSSSPSRDPALPPPPALSSSLVSRPLRRRHISHCLAILINRLVYIDASLDTINGVLFQSVVLVWDSVGFLGMGRISLEYTFALTHLL